jgi:dihydrofolate synthase/folylpolyglutamate synthase
MTYPDAITHLGSARRFGMKLGLEPMQALAGRMRNPQEGLRFIHIAGTNGKGSTAAFCESCLRAAGYRVGLYTSPHLVSIRERIQINRKPISEEAFGEGMAAVVAAAGESEPTFFELMTALALWYFAREKVDWVVWETGLGGRLDATNIVMPAICIITNVSLEHTQYLGKDLESVAREKAGIIKRGVPVVHAVHDQTVGTVIDRICRELDSKLFLVAPKATQLPESTGMRFRFEDLGLREGRQWARFVGREFELGLIGGHQVANAACATAALGVAGAGADFEEMARGLKETSWPGRFQIVSESPLIVLDGAHNTAAMEELIKIWRAVLKSRGLPEGQAQLVFASSADKDITEMVKPLDAARHFPNLFLPRMASERAADPAGLAPHFAQASKKFFPESVAAWKPLPMPALVTGSLFLVGEMLAHLSGQPHEILLNERLETSPPSP